MTKYFKLLGVALIAMSMALVSCEEPSEGNDPGTVNPEPEPEPEPEPTTPGIKVTFGSQSWDAETAVGMCSPMDGDVLAIALSEKDSMYVWPRADVYVWTNGATAPTTFQDNFIINEQGQFCICSLL